MNFVRTAIRQPVTVTVGVILVLLAGVIALQRIPIQLTPNVEDTIVAVSTFWEGASPDEVEQEVVDPQEEKLQGLANLRSLTSVSRQGQGQIRLEFAVGMSKDEALREVSDKLREVPDYPEGVDEPVVEASDPENRDFIAWIVFESDDPTLDVRTLNDFVQDRIEPRLERVSGMAEVNVLGGREREVQIRFDPVLLAQRGITVAQMAEAVQRTNRNASAGALREDKSDVRLRLVSQYTDVREVEDTIVAETASGTVRVADVAEVVESYKEPRSFVRSRGKPVIAINAQREVGANVMEVMAGLRAAIDELNRPGGVLDTEARQRGLSGGLRLTQVYDQTVYIDDALLLVRNNIWIGGALAMLVLLLFLRSLRSAGIIAVAIPISIVGAIVVMVGMGRSINVISLAGMAFAVGMVVDNAIVVLENVYRHIEMGKAPMQAAYDGAREVSGAVLASTLTTVVVFVPILLVEEEAGQLFRDIALAIVAAVSLSLLVSITVIPTGAARLLKPQGVTKQHSGGRIARWISATVYWLSGSVLARVGIVLVFTAASLIGTWMLLPPADYLPSGNRNLVFGLLIPPPGYSLDQRAELGNRIEEQVEPFWEAGLFEPGSPEYAAAVAALPEIPTFDLLRMQPGPPIVPPPLENYFLVSFDDIVFHGGVSLEPERAVDVKALMEHASRAEVAPGVFGFAFQVPLFRLGGSSGSAVKINFTGDDLEQVSRSALVVFLEMMGRYGPGTVQPDPGNFNVPSPELQVVPDLQRLGEVGLSPAGLALAVQAMGDGAFLGDYRKGGDTIDLKLIAAGALDPNFLYDLGDQPIATPSGSVVPLRSLATLRRVNAPPQINHAARQRAVTLQFTPPVGKPLEEAIAEVAALLEQHRERGTIPPEIGTSYTGSAAKLDAVQGAMLGDGTVAGTLSSSLFLALVVVYLLMCVLFQSFLRPLIILFSVPLATLGGFAALYGVHVWSLLDRYMPIQNLDILTMLGFVILIGVVVNNAILIVHQSSHFMRGIPGESEPRRPREAIAEAVRTRVRPIFMSTLTSVGGMAPLVLMPGSGSELYRGLGSVVVGGLLVSTVFTLLLVPLLLSLVSDVQERLGILPERRAAVLEQPAGARVQPRTALLSLFALALFLAVGCAHTGNWSDPDIAEMVGDLNASQTEPAGPIGGPEQELITPDSPVEQSVAARLPELEALGGPEAFESVQPALPPDLLGEGQRTLRISLWRCITASVENNLGMRIASLQPEIAQQGITVAEAVFDPRIFTDLSYEDRDELNVLPSVVDPDTGDSFRIGSLVATRTAGRVQAGIAQRLTSGATVGVSTFLQRAAEDSPGLDFEPNPAWRSGVSLGVTQPLMRGYGKGVNRTDIELSKLAYERTLQDMKAELLLLVAGTEQAFWDLREAWELLKVREVLKASGEEVERVLAERRAFDAELAQFADAQATVERRRADMVQAQRLLKAASDRLKVLMYADVYPTAGELLLEPAEDFIVDPITFELRDAVELGLQKRPEIQASLLRIEDARLRERLADNLLLPQLDLTAEVAFSGLDGTAGGSYESLVGDDAYQYLIGLSFELPVRNRAARSELRATRLAARESVLRYEQATLEVVFEVKDALRDVRTSFALIAARRSLRIAETENLRALTVEGENRGRLTPEFLNLKFQRQERLALAQAQEVESMASYCRSLAAYYRAVGTGPDLARFAQRQAPRQVPDVEESPAESPADSGE